VELFEYLQLARTERVERFVEGPVLGIKQTWNRQIPVSANASEAAWFF
jgi:hypothetical protein